ncbi:MAG TPA: penicillin-binding transpeptidase domain-containing protein [Planctomycetota bacterium]|nr:penicillin-binding transpeptidase domain-containing protein [Planctomycetota bacterium]
MAVSLTWFVLGARAFQVQGLEAEDYRAQIRILRSHPAYEAPKRGDLTDRQGREIARQVRHFDLWITPSALERDADPLARTAALLGAPTADLAADLSKVMSRIQVLVEREPDKYRARRRKSEMRYPWATQRRVPFEAAYEIELRPELYPGFSVREALRREYPYGEIGSHLIGYVGTIQSEEEKARLVREGAFVPASEDEGGAQLIEALMRRGEFDKEMIGRSGAEKLLDRDLRGKGGLVIRGTNLETGARSTTVLSQAERGRDVALTIDIEFQRIVERIIDQQSHSHVVALVAEAASGDILAMACKPRFNPNAFIPPVDSGMVNSLLKDPLKPLMNRAISGEYQLGSIFKVVTAWAGLTHGKLSPHEFISCRGKMFERDDAFRCWIYRQSGQGHGPINLSAALERSCNCYFYEVGRRLGLGPLEETARDFGFGRRTTLGLGAEARGGLPSDGRPTRWAPTDTMSLAIGQASLIVTPIQVLRMMLLVANGGEGPSLGIRHGEARPFDRLGISTDSIAAIRKGLRDVVQGSAGTAHQTELRKFKAAGKTGSAQTSRNQASHAWFAGYAPAEEPKYVVVVLIEHGLSGGEAAAPIAAHILEALQTQ